MSGPYFRSHQGSPQRFRDRVSHKLYGPGPLFPPVSTFNSAWTILRYTVFELVFSEILPPAQKAEIEFI
jgi:hypothetical protein